MSSSSKKEPAAPQKVEKDLVKPDKKEGKWKTGYQSGKSKRRVSA